MPSQVLTNLFVGFLWMLLQNSWHVLTFLTGYLVGLFILFTLRRYLKSKFYPITLLAAINLFLVFVWETITSGIFVAKRVLQPKIKVTPGIFSLDPNLDTDVELTLLAMLITLTPGSVVMEICPDTNRFFIHVMDIPESIDAVNKSSIRFEKAIKKVTR